MSQDESIRDVATEIALWQGVALKLPLPEVQDMASSSLNYLAQTLDAFNKTYLDEDQAEEALGHAVVEVARQATAAAIFTLGASQRASLAAERN
jgi:hypothetical protein